MKRRTTQKTRRPRHAARLTAEQRALQNRLRADGVRVPAAVIREADAQIDRYIERWASRLLIVKRSPSGKVTVKKVGKERARSLMAKLNKAAKGRT